jgi:hypothetical protein
MAPAVPAYADGGIINAKTISQELANMGRNGDTMLAHITPGEAALLRRRGGSGTINPVTGLPEFFFKKVFKKIGKVVKGVVKGVGKVIKKIAQSPIGRIALTMAAVYFMGPLAPALGITNAALATAVNTFAGSTLVNLASGQKLGQALKGGIISGAMAGAVTGIMSPSSTPAAAGTPSTPAPVVEGSFTPTGAGLDSLATPAIPDVSTFDISQGVQGAQGLQGIQGVPMPAAPAPMPAVQAPMPAAPVAPVQPTAATPSTFTTPANIDNAYIDQLAKNAATPPPTPGVMDSLKAAYKNISPSAIQEQGMSDALKSVQDKFGVTAQEVLKAPAGSVLSEAYKDALPGMLSKYGPMAAVGLGAAYLGGAFKPIPAEEPANMDQFKTTGADLLAQDPSKYGLSFGGVNTTYGPNPYARQNNPYQTAAAPAPVALAKGGIASLEDFPRKNGPISGPGTGTSDSVPAMLSDGEFVFTAKAVRAMGQGSRRKGAKRMYALMKQLEAKGK